MAGHGAGARPQDRRVSICPRCTARWAGAAGRAIAAAWESATHQQTGSLAAIKTFKNTELGETWVEEGEAPDWQRLMERREDYPIGQVPTGGLLLVGGADIQKDRIEVSIWAFGRGKEAWLVEHRVLMGDTVHDAVWKSLAALLAETWTHASGAQLPLVRFGLDTGFATQETYAFIRTLKDPRVMGMKGTAHGAALIGTPTAVDISRQGKRLRRGIKVYSVAVGIAKLEFYNNLRKVADVAEDGTTPVYPAGYVHLPKVDAEYLQQLCAEQLVTHRDRQGYAKREWQKMRERNEALDAYVYARAAAAAAGLDRFEDRHWLELERPLGVADNPRGPTIEFTHEPPSRGHPQRWPCRFWHPVYWPAGVQEPLDGLVRKKGGDVLGGPRCDTDAKKIRVLRPDGTGERHSARQYWPIIRIAMPET